MAGEIRRKNPLRNSFGVTIPEFGPAQQEAWAALMQAIASGLSLRKGLQIIERMEGAFHKADFYLWLNYSAEPNAEPPFIGLSDQYARAIKLRTDSHLEEIQEIGERASESTYRDAQGEIRVDPGAVQAARVMIDTIKWTMGKQAPAKWGDKLQVDAETRVIVENAPESPDE